MDEQILIKSTRAYDNKKICIITIIIGFVSDPIILTFDSLIRWGDISILDSCEMIPFVAFGLPILSIIIGVLILLFKSEITITNRRVYGVSIFGKRVDLPIDSISAIATQNWLKGLSVSTSSGSINFIGIDNYIQVHHRISALLVDRQQVNNIVESHTNDKLDEIKKLKELLDIGAITQEEFDAKKKELLEL